MSVSERPGRHVWGSGEGDCRAGPRLALGDNSTLARPGDEYLDSIFVYPDANARPNLKTLFIGDRTLRRN